ncbi:hypothetical protein SDC9_145610 [bioreactor metagenome]|uniref:Uncharacterized protein n=1 Tax=bioreactor metagenome TaxID=1076179 RepID=A0A645E8W2_9ZZZZ
MQHAVGGAAERHIHRKRVCKRGLGENLRRANVFFDQLNYLHPRVFCQPQAFRIDRGNCAVAGQRHTDCLAQAGHGVCGKHAGAGAAAGTRVVFAKVELFLCCFSGFERTNRFEHAVEVEVLAAALVGEHRPRRDEHRRQIQPRRCHQHAGNDLVASGQKHHAVESMCLRHNLAFIRDDFAAGKRIVHAFVTHRDAVAYADGAKLNRGSARHADARLDGLGQLIEVEVPRYNLVSGVCDAD